MKILLVSYHNPNFINTGFYRERAVEYAGHELIAFDDRSFWIPGTIRDKFSGLQRWDLGRINDDLVRLAKKRMPEVCFVIGGHRILPETVKILKKLGVRMALWTTDVPIDFVNILNAAPYYEYLFCSGTEAKDIFDEHGLGHAQWIPFGCDPAYHKPVRLTDDERKEYGHDIVFVGSYYPNRARLLETIADLDVRIWGPYWNKLANNSLLKNKFENIKINYDRWVKIYSAAKMVLVSHYADPKVPCHQASPKLFEAMACGSFVLVDEQKDVRALFQDKKHVVFFKDSEDLRAKIKYYLSHPEERLRIAEQGREEVLRFHTYQARFEKMLAIMDVKG